MGSTRQHGRPTGHLQVRGRRGERRWHALWRDADGRHQRVLGFAHVKDSGRRTTRGAVIWRVADGAPPTPQHLTPEQAAEALDTILVKAAREPTKTDAARPAGVATFGDAVAQWLEYVEHEKERKPSTIRDYRNVARHDLLPRFGADTPLREVVRGRIVGDRFTVDDIEAFRRDLLARDDISTRTAQKILVLCSGVFKLAKRRRLIETNPCTDAERIAVRPNDDFNILSPAEFEQVVACCGGELATALLSVAFYAGLRMGEVRELRWRDVDHAKRMLYVRSGASAGRRGTTKGGRVRSIPLVSQLADRLKALRDVSMWSHPDDYVFPRPTGEPVTEDTARSFFYDALGAAGFGDRREELDKHGSPQKPIVFHDLRHSYCSWAVDVWPIPDVKAFAGHRDISTTMKYVHRSAKASHALMADTALEAMLG